MMCRGHHALHLTRTTLINAQQGLTRLFHPVAIVIEVLKLLRVRLQLLLI